MRPSVGRTTGWWPGHRAPRRTSHGSGPTTRYELPYTLRHLSSSLGIPTSMPAALCDGLSHAATDCWARTVSHLQKGLQALRTCMPASVQQMLL
jgi:hypothetical protein